MTPMEWFAVIAALVAIGVVGRFTRRQRRRARFLIRRLEDRVADLEANLRHAEADRDHISAELDQAYAAAAEVARSRCGAQPDAEQVLLDAAVQLGKLREQRDALAVELRAVTADRDALAARAAEFERSNETQSAIIDGATDAIMELGNDCIRRDAAIEAMTARIAELMRDRAALHGIADAVQRGAARPSEPAP